MKLRIVFLGLLILLVVFIAEGHRLRVPETYLTTVLNSNRAYSDFDIRHSFSAAMSYNVSAVNRCVFTTAVTGGWAAETFGQIHSAPPASIIDGAFAALTLQDASIDIRPDTVADQPLYLFGQPYPGGKALNPNASTNPPLDPATGLLLRQGNLGRNALRAFDFARWDLAIHRDFPIRESLKLQFRAEMFNFLNHPNFGIYNSTFGTGDPYFGQSTSMLEQSLQGFSGGAGAFSPQYQLGGPRSIQLALKLFF